MRFTSSAVLAFATSLTLVAAQDLTGLPSCALPCFATAIPASGCSITDTSCQCTTGRSSIQSSLLSCAPARCSATDLVALAPAVAALCAKAGVTISDVPTAAASGSASGSATASRTSVAASQSATGSAAVASSTGAAGVNVVGWGTVAMGIAAGVFGA